MDIEIANARCKWSAKSEIWMRHDGKKLASFSNVPPTICAALVIHRLTTLEGSWEEGADLRGRSGRSSRVAGTKGAGQGRSLVARRVRRNGSERPFLSSVGDKETALKMLSAPIYASRPVSQRFDVSHTHPNQSTTNLLSHL